MGLEDEIDVYDKAKASVDTGEIEDYDAVFFQNVIRRREIVLIQSELQALKPRRILDFGCGGGWLSRILASFECEVVGVDINRSLIKCAKIVAPTVDFVVGDCMKLPFRENSFDVIVGIAILHHLTIYNGLCECHRVARIGSLLLFIEPNKLNPISALGRKIFPMQTHTKGERPLRLRRLVRVFAHASLTIKKVKHLFPYSFGLARIFRRWSAPYIIVPLVSASEELLERVPIVRSLSSSIFIVAIRN